MAIWRDKFYEWLYCIAQFSYWEYKKKCLSVYIMINVEKYWLSFHLCEFFSIDLISIHIINVFKLRLLWIILPYNKLYRIVCIFADKHQLHK